MNSTLPSALVHRPPKVITPTSRYAPRDDWCFAASKNVGADSISARARLRQDKLPRAHIECAPTDYVSGQREKAPRGAPPLCGGGCRFKNVGADSISARACLRQDKPPRAHIECAPTDYVSDKGRKLRAGHRPLRGVLCRFKNVGADSISARARLRQDKPPRAHIECAPTDLVSGQQGHPQKNAATLFYCKIAWLRFLFWLCV